MKAVTKKFLAMICVASLMLIDLKAGNASWYIYIITDNMVGIAVSLIMFSVYSIKEYIKPFYIGWSVFGFLGVIGGMAFWYTHQVGHVMGWWYTVPFNVWILGIHFFKYIEKIFITKELKIKFTKWEYVFIVCMVLMLISESEFIWPFYFLVIFIMLWHLPLSLNDKKEIFSGVLNGIVLGFVLLQGYGFINRHYVKIRYTGAYWNSNRNGALYLFAFTAFLAKLIIVEHKRKLSIDTGGGLPKDIKKFRFLSAFYLLLSAIMAGFIMYTGSRNSLIGMAVIFVIFVFAGERKIVRMKWMTIIKQMVAFGMIWVISIPLLYFPICYLPIMSSLAVSELKSLKNGNGLFPIRTLSNDYCIQYDEALDNMVLRYLRSDVNDTLTSENAFIESEEMIDEEHIDVLDETIETSVEGDYPYSFDIKKYDTKDDCYVVEYYFRDYPERGMGVLYVPKCFYNGIVSWNIRMDLFATLISNMNLTGHDSSELFFVIRSSSPSEEETWAGNEQNFIIHYLFSFGVPVGLLFCILIFGELFYLLYLTFKGKIEAFVFAMLVLVFILIGLMEIDWIPGQVLFVMLFFGPLFFDGDYFELLSKREAGK